MFRAHGPPGGEALRSDGSQPASIREREGPGEPRAARGEARPRRPGTEGSAAARAALMAARSAPPGPMAAALLPRALLSRGRPASAAAKRGAVSVRGWRGGAAERDAAGTSVLGPGGGGSTARCAVVRLSEKSSSAG